MASCVFEKAFDVGKDAEIACKTYSGVVEAVASMEEVARTHAEDMIENSSDVFTEKDSRGAQFIVQIPDDNNSSKSRGDNAKTSPMVRRAREKPKDKTNYNNNSSPKKKAKRCELKRRKAADAGEPEEEQVPVKQRRIVHRLKVRWHTVGKYQPRRLTLHPPAYPANNCFEDQCMVSADSPIVSADSSPMVCHGREKSQACHHAEVGKCEVGKVGKEIDKHDPPDEKPRKSRRRRRRRKNSADAGNDVEMNEEETAITTNENNNKTADEKAKTRRRRRQQGRKAANASGTEQEKPKVVQGMSEEEIKRIASGIAKILAGCIQIPPVTPRIGKIEDGNISEHWISAVEQAFEVLLLKGSLLQLF